MALEGMAALVSALPRIVVEPGDRRARADALYGAWLCGTCLGAVGMALHHKLCHTLGGTFDLPHAATHTIMLPHALAYNAPAIPDVMAQLRTALGAPRALRDLGMPERGIAEVARRAVANAYWNPRPLEFEPIQTLIMRAWAGQPPQQ